MQLILECIKTLIPGPGKELQSTTRGNSRFGSTRINSEITQLYDLGCEELMVIRAEISPFNSANISSTTAMIDCVASTQFSDFEFVCKLELPLKKKP